jgi:hypothetical protein
LPVQLSQVLVLIGWLLVLVRMFAFGPVREWLLGLGLVLIGWL